MFIPRDVYALPRVEAMLSEEFPDEAVPPLTDLIRNTSLLINHGSPFTGKPGDVQPSPAQPSLTTQVTD